MSGTIKDLKERGGDSHSIPIQSAYLACAQYRWLLKDSGLLKA